MKTLIAIAAVALACAAADTPKLVPIGPASSEVDDAATGIKVRVSIGRFLMSPAEVTQSEFEGVMGYNPSVHKGADLPVESVTWWEAIRYANLRSAREGLEPCYDLVSGAGDLSRNGYRLPTDAEWTLAAGKAPDTARIRDVANLGSADTKDTALLAKALSESSTRPVGSYAANEFGLHDMLGNVWEWCTDWFNPVATPQRTANPAGPLRGLARVVRGGSFISTTSQWSRGYRFQMEPERKSRFTGFRVCRTAPEGSAEPERTATWFEPYNRVPPGFEHATGDLTPLPTRTAIERKWRALLFGAAPEQPQAPAVKLIETVREQNYTGKLMYLQVEPDWWEKIFVMMPEPAPRRPLPVVIVPYYDVDVPAGRNMGGTTFTPGGVRAFAYLAAQRGFIAVAIRWWGQSYGEGVAEAVANVKRRHPNMTGMGKWVQDSRRLVDWLSTLPEVDRSRIGMIGHSLGAKMTLYAMAMDDRINAGVFSEGGIGLGFSNYDDYWYLGEATRSLEKGTDHHELLALIAPRPFLLIGGDDADSDKSWYYVNAVRPIYERNGTPQQIGYFNHRSGHSPTPEAVRLAMDWLERFLGGSR
ncbi:MAG TPA: SUMF1/EgtB/PvdO family nonheme iron enzyme [Bryobacteraceae bacterium]|nr:SUMF1/EgtB/PvdO family nonheme iron enzyme [Bryobacteraceae bacterium]